MKRYHLYHHSPLGMERGFGLSSWFGTLFLGRGSLRLFKTPFTQEARHRQAGNGREHYVIEPLIYEPGLHLLRS
jgi:hypothetical protein